VGSILVTAVFIHSSKEDDLKTNEQSLQDAKEHDENSHLQDIYIEEQRAKMMEAKDSLKRMTEQMKQLNLATLPSVPVDAGRVWPLKKTYITKVENEKLELD